MTTYVEVPIGDLFRLENGEAKFIKDYLDVNSGEYPVYSASLTKPFGHVNEYRYEGRHLTWVMNGYGGRMQEVDGRFSANRDRGVFVPKAGQEAPDLTYLRFILEPQLVAAAVGRRVDGRRNDYTKIYPEIAQDIPVKLPVTAAGSFDFAKMAELGAKCRRIETARHDVQSAHDALMRASVTFDPGDPVTAVSLGDRSLFELSIGKRVLRSEFTERGVPVYSANVLQPFGSIKSSNLTGFDTPSLLWGIDGNFDWNLIPAETEFATTDHCGRLRILSTEIDPDYALWYLKATRWQYGFDRTYRASLGNIMADVTLAIPTDDHGVFSLGRQRSVARSFALLEQTRRQSLEALSQVLAVQIGIDAIQ